MNNYIYSVIETDGSDDFKCEYFGNNRDDAIKYLKLQKIIIDQDLKGWTKEIGINNYSWHSGEQYRSISLQMQELSNEKM